MDLNRPSCHEAGHAVVALFLGFLVEEIEVQESENTMTTYYGVKCATCGIRIALGRCEALEVGKIVFYAPPPEPVPCKSCGSSHLYRSDDLFPFEAEDERREALTGTSP
jgi:hypothetical protein